MLLFSCTSNERKLNIDDFAEKINDTLIPKKNGTYTAAIYEINGIVNDTVLITFYGIEKQFFGEFKFKFNLDYYGGLDVPFEFDPYKATEGKISIVYGIY